MLFQRTVADAIVHPAQPAAAELRRFLVTLFTRDELDLLCADYFRDVYEELEGVALTKSALAQKLIDYCRRHGAMPLLHAALQRLRPEAVAQHLVLSSAALPLTEPQRRMRDVNRIFISYAHDDRLVARRLASDLHANSFGVWLAPDDIHPGEPWVSAIDRGMHECGIFLALLSPSAIKSAWVKSETRLAIQLEHQGKLRLLPVTVRACDPAKVSAFLASYQAISLSRYERGLAELLAELEGDGEREQPPQDADVPQLMESREQIDAAGTLRDPAMSIARTTLAARHVLTEPFKMDLIRITAGSFWMGSHPKRDPYAQANERPRHRVRLSEFFIARYPVTNEQYAVFARATQRDFKLSVGKASHPVVNVSWDEARAFCDWLSDITEQRFMLPSEAEWEKAARGTDGRIYPWGDAFDATRVNSCMSGVSETVPVDHFSPNGDSPYGVADMCGNAWEWCDDWFDDDTYAARARSRVQDPLGPQHGTLRALRGGAFDFDHRAVRCAYRVGALPYERSYDYGFRMVMRP